MGKEKNNVRFFLTQDKAGKELDHMLWSRKANALMAMARPIGVPPDPEGIFIVTLPEVIEQLVAGGYTEVDESYLTSLRITDYTADRIDYTIYENEARYTKPKYA